MPTQNSHYVPESALDLKHKANDLYTQKDFSGSFALYTHIIDQYVDAPPSFLRIIRCNRAACCIELGYYQDGMNDLQWVLHMIPQGSHEAQSVSQKAHFRFARCLFELKRFGEAIRQIDQYREVVGGQSTNAEKELRSRILHAIVENDGGLQGQATDIERPTIDRQLRYEVMAYNSEPAIVLFDAIPDTLCSEHPPAISSKIYAVQLLTKHHDSILNKQDWRCWNCLSQAVSFIHSPALYFHLPEPKIVDYIQPICNDGGDCDIAARKMMAETMHFTAYLARVNAMK